MQDHSGIKRRTQKGSALVAVLSVTLLIFLLMASGTSMVIGARKTGAQQFTREGQANNIARAGLVAAESWFKNQPAQPVKQDTLEDDQLCSIHRAFHPRENISTPLSGDTLDEDIGLVKELKVQEPNIYGRYIVRRYDCSKPASDPHNQRAAKDITFERGKNDGTNPEGQGVVWALQSQGIVYLKNDSEKEPNELPNRVLQEGKSAVELYRVAMAAPKSPITLIGTSTSNFNNNCNVIGDAQTAFGILRNSNTPGTGTPNFTLPGSANVTHQLPSEDNKSVESVFNMTKDELKGLSTAVYNSVSQISDGATKSNKQMNFGIHYLEGSGTGTFTFGNSDTKPSLLGSGVLFVNGNLTLEADSNSSFSGLVFVTGTITIAESNQIGGALIAGRVNCQPANSAIIEYSDNVMTNVRQRLGLYRQNNLTLSTRTY